MEQRQKQHRKFLEQKDFENYLLSMSNILGMGGAERSSTSTSTARTARAGWMNSTTVTNTASTATSAPEILDEVGFLLDDDILDLQDESGGQQLLVLGGVDNEIVGGGVVEPTPIGSDHQVNVVKNVSVLEDQTLQKSGIANDLIHLMMMRASSTNLSAAVSSSLLLESKTEPPTTTTPKRSYADSLVSAFNSNHVDPSTTTTGSTTGTSNEGINDDDDDDVFSLSSLEEQHDTTALSPFFSPSSKVYGNKKQKLTDKNEECDSSTRMADTTTSTNHCCKFQFPTAQMSGYFSDNINCGGTPLPPNTTLKSLLLSPSSTTAAAGAMKQSNQNNKNTGDALATLLPPVDPISATATDATTPSIPRCSANVQTMQWYLRYQDLIAYKAVNGHCCVPNVYPSNPQLAQWVKRQRYQYKLKQDGKHSTLSEERERILNEIGFIWDSHSVAWMEHFNDLMMFRQHNGHCNVPSKYPENHQLSIWVKCQRRQYKLHRSGSARSTMTPDRIEKLESLGFVWNPRNLP